MSTKTKGFFQQDHGQKQWRRAQHNAPLNPISHNARPNPPPIPATSQAKSKLEAFAFAGQVGPDQDKMDEQAMAGNEDPEKAITNDRSVAEPGEGTAGEEYTVPSQEAKMREHSAGNAAQQSNKTPQLPHANTFPSTPGMRIPLEELIGSFDESNRKIQLPQESPEERIGWIPNSSSTLLTPNRKRKRARSSSPSCPTTSSQRQEASAFFAGTGGQDKRTPEADPAAALWKQYASNKETDVDGLTELPTVNKLMFEGSPRALETPAKNAGFRRWASTGNDWPTSRTKKRRTATRTSINLWQDAQVVESAGRSKVSAMVDRIQESLATQKLASSEAKPVVRISAPSSSSPLPEAAAMPPPVRQPAASPLQSRQPTRQQAVPPVQSRSGQHGVASASRTAQYPVESEGDSRGALDPAPEFRPTRLHLQSKAPLPAYKRPSVTRAPSNDGQKSISRPPAMPVTAPLPAPAIDADEFGEDFDLSAEDLDELMDGNPPLHQRSLHQIPAHPNPPPSRSFDPPCHQRPDQGRGAAGQQNASILVHDFDDDDEFACDDLDEASLAQVEFSATQAYRKSPRRRSPRKMRSSSKSQRRPSEAAPLNAARRLQRFVVKQIVEGEYTNTKGRRCPEKVLLADSEGSLRLTAISLRESWYNTSLANGTIVHVAHLPGSKSEGASNPPGQVTLSDVEDSPLLIIHPDHMLSATTVADSFDCIRKAVLQDRIKATGEASKAMVYGSILHEIFQQALSANRWDDTFLKEMVERTVTNHVEGLWELGMVDTVLAIEEIRAKMSELASWAKTFVAAQPSNSSVIDDRKGEKVWLSVSKLIAVEEHIWSPKYGLKGNVDATVQTSLLDHPKEPVKKLVAPFEVKTGKTSQSAAHVAQTALYTLLMSDRYDIGVKAGILYYLESSAMMRVAPRVLEVRQMIQQRNRLAGYIHWARHPSKKEEPPPNNALPTQEIEESGLPGMLRNPDKCGRCYAQASCFSYHALAEGGNADSAGMVDNGKKNHGLIWHEAVGHLQLTAKDVTEADAFKAWFSKWDRLLTFEESDISRYRQELWTMDSADREAVGRCFGKMVLAQELTATASAPGSAGIDGIGGSGGTINRFAYRFVRSSAAKRITLNEGTELTVGEPIAVSSESGHWALANGYVVASSKRDITVAVDRRLGDARQRDADFNEDQNQSLKGVMTVGCENDPATIPDAPAMLYRLDKAEFSNGLALIRNNLVTLMSSHPIHTKLRRQIVLGAAPNFAASSAPPALRESQLTTMNEDQRDAVSKVLAAQDYALILGMPGTGKTTTIAQLIGALLAERKSILLTSYTHTAVDNILLKIRDIAPPNSILRLGVPAKINAEVQKFCRLGSTSRGSIAEVDEAYMGSQIVAATCLSTNHALFSRRAFDVCIVDEASQITMPISLGPLLRARKFVLVGDHYQLPPLVQDKAALEGGLDVSLFRQLSEGHPHAVAALGKQYRMCEEIMSLSNALIYDGKLRCGNDDVAQRVLDVSRPAALASFHAADQSCATPSRDNACWLEELCKPERKVVFANTDPAGKNATEMVTSGRNITNQYEATITAQLVVALLAVGVSAREIGVITLYRSQLALLRQLFKSAGISSEVEIDSADRFQGRDKECVVLSMVRSNEAGVVGDLLKDWRRVNVALTRARSKLVVLGSRQTLRNNDLLDRFLRLVEGKRWTLELPSDADACHNFNFSSQALTSLTTPGTAQKRNLDTPATTRRAEVEPSSFVASPSKRLGVLQPSPSLGNRSHAGSSGKIPGKVIFGRSSQKQKAAKMKENAVIQIFEDLTGEG